MFSEPVKEITSGHARNLHHLFDREHHLGVGPEMVDQFGNLLRVAVRPSYRGDVFLCHGIFFRKPGLVRVLFGSHEYINRGQSWGLSLEAMPGSPGYHLGPTFLFLPARKSVGLTPVQRLKARSKLDEWL